MLKKIRQTILALAFALVASSCNASSQENHTPSPPAGSDKTNDSKVENPDHQGIISLAEEIGITGAHGSNYSDIDRLKDGTHVVIYETFSSRSKYKTITPIWMESSRLIIDCSYIHSIEDSDIISAGSYCRGKTLASSETIEDAVSDEHTAPFTSNHSWMSDASVPDCDKRTAMAYKIIRCVSGESQETTEKTVTYVFANNLSLLVEMPGFEFSGYTEDDQSLVFWKLYEDSPHEIVHWRLPRF